MYVPKQICNTFRIQKCKYEECLMDILRIIFDIFMILFDFQIHGINKATISYLLLSFFLIYFLLPPSSCSLFLLSIANFRDDFEEQIVLSIRTWNALLFVFIRIEYVDWSAWNIPGLWCCTPNMSFLYKTFFTDAKQ